MRPASGLLLLAVACQKADTTPTTTTGDTGATEQENLFPLPDDLDTIDFQQVFTDAVRMMVTVNVQQAWTGHVAAIEGRAPGCPDFWTGQFTVAGELVGSDDGVAWNDDCITPDGRIYDGWTWWDSSVSNVGDPDTYEGKTSEGSRSLSGKGTVSTDDDIQYVFDGDASDSLYEVTAYGGYHRVVYNTSVDGTVGGSSVFDPSGETPKGYRTDLVMSLTGGDVDNFQARGNVYLYEPVLDDRFDSIGVDMELQGPLGAGPDACTKEPLGWIGIRDPDAYWYDVVFLPRDQEDIVDIDYANDPLSVCDGCGKLYVQGIEQDQEICVDFSFLFDGTSVPVPTIQDYVLPWHSL